MGINSQERLATLETEKKRKYYVLANKLGSEMYCKTEIIPYVKKWEGVVTNYHKNNSKCKSDSIGAYIQAIVLESISFDYRREDLTQSENPPRLAKVDVEEETLRDTGT